MVAIILVVPRTDPAWLFVRCSLPEWLGLLVPQLNNRSP
jgi:hypothetical protein